MHGDRLDVVEGFERARFPLPFSRQARWSGAQARMRLARLLVKLNGRDIATARAEYERAIILIEPVAEEFPDVFWTHSLLLSSVAGLASVTPGDDAKPLCDRAVRVWREFIENSKRAYESNELAWMMLVSDLSDELAGRAVEIAQHAVDAGPNSGNLNTLGVAMYRVGRYADAVEALLKSEENEVPSSAYNEVFLAMAHFRLGNRVEARRWFDKAVEIMDKSSPQNQELQRFRAEAAELLAISESSPKPQSDEVSTVE
jgi:tetratricopeptide (TPR) repeat protein